MIARIISMWIACGGEARVTLPAGEDPPGAVDPGGPGDGGGSPTPPGTVDTTYYADVQPLLAESCARCHGESGLGPGNFLDYATSAAWAEVMADRVASGEMPPPAADPECHPYEGSEVAGVHPDLLPTLERWIEQGKAEGDPSTAEAFEVWEPPTLSRTDVELLVDAPYTPQFVEANEYRCFLLGDTIPADTWISGIEFVMDNPQISHHALLFLDPDGGSEALIEDPATRSWVCPEVQPRPEWLLSHAWAPGGGAVEFDEGQGLKVAAGTQVILQMHYWQGISPTPADQPGYAFKVEREIEEEIFYIGLGPDDFLIPAGDPSYTATEEIDMFWLSFGLLEYDVLGVMPHMHVLGTGYEFKSIEPDGVEKCISRSDAYDFALQPTYWFEDPVTVEPDETLSISCTWDNSADNPRQVNDPPQAVSWGENTQQEMCFALMYIHARTTF